MPLTREFDGVARQAAPVLNSASGSAASSTSAGELGPLPLLLVSTDTVADTVAVTVAAQSPQ